MRKHRLHHTPDLVADVAPIGNAEYEAALDTALAARRIVGEMNLDEILSTSHMAGKTNHIVKSGDSFLGIASRYKTSIDCIMHLEDVGDSSKLAALLVGNR